MRARVGCMMFVSLVDYQYRERSSDCSNMSYLVAMGCNGLLTSFVIEVWLRSIGGYASVRRQANAINRGSRSLLLRPRQCPRLLSCTHNSF